MTLSPEAWEQWVAGAYYRAYALHKDPRQLERAGTLLAELQTIADERIPGTVLSKRIRRLRGRVLISLGNSRGRREILAVLNDIGGVRATISAQEKELARLASDLCGDLSSIGEHDKAVALMEHICKRDVEDQELDALRHSLLASWLNQRAVARDAAADRAGARSDLQRAEFEIDKALTIRRRIMRKIDHDQQLELRECHAIELSIRIERSRGATLDLTSEIDELKALLIETGDFESAEETPLQLALRVGRLGGAHLRNRSARRPGRRPENAMRAQAYLRYAWEYARNSMLRPWLALDLCEALAKTGQRETAQEIAAASLARLIPQCGEAYAPNAKLREYAAESKPRAPAAAQGHGS